MSIASKLRQVGAGYKDIVYVGGTTHTPSDVSATEASLTSLTGGVSSSAAAGDLVIAFYNISSGREETGMYLYAPFTASPAFDPYDYVGGRQYLNDSPDATALIGYRVLPTAEDHVYVTNTGGNAAGMVAIHVFRDIDQSDPIESSYFPTFPSNNPPAASLLTPKSILVAGVGGTAFGATSVYSSSDLTDFQTGVNAENGYGSVVGVGYSDVSDTDPAAFTGGTSKAIAFTLVIRPERQ